MTQWKVCDGTITTARLKVIQSEWKEGGSSDVSRLLGTLFIQVLPFLGTVASLQVSQKTPTNLMASNKC